MNPSRRYDKGGMAGEGIWAEKIKAGGGGHGDTTRWILSKDQGQSFKSPSSCSHSEAISTGTGSWDLHANTLFSSPFNQFVGRH